MRYGSSTPFSALVKIDHSRRRQVLTGEVQQIDHFFQRWFLYEFHLVLQVNFNLNRRSMQGACLRKQPSIMARKWRLSSSSKNTTGILWSHLTLIKTDRGRWSQKLSGAIQRAEIIPPFYRWIKYMRFTLVWLKLNMAFQHPVSMYSWYVWLYNHTHTYCLLVFTIMTYLSIDI